MKNIAFRRAKNTPIIEQLHDNFIVEFADTSLFPYGFHKKEDGWEFMDKEKFEKELAKNQKLNESFFKAKEKEDLEKALAKEKSAPIDEELKEFRAWKAWKASQNK